MEVEVENRMELLSPYAPLWPWLARAMCGTVYIRASGVRDVPSEVLSSEMDCRDLQTRVAVLSALASVGYSLPWALGGIWSPLTDEQAGRAVAEAIRRVGEDPQAPTGVIPRAVLNPWTVYPRRSWTYPKAGDGFHLKSEAAKKSPDAWAWWEADGRLKIAGGPEGDAAGRAAASTYAMSNGALLWEQVTPEVKA